MLVIFQMKLVFNTLYTLCSEKNTHSHFLCMSDVQI